MTERQRRARALRAKGETYENIGQQLGVSRQRAYQLVNGNPGSRPQKKRRAAARPKRRK